MRILRSIMLAIAATLGASGCAAWNTGTLATTPRPRPLAEQSFDVDEFVVAHNRNSDRIQSLEAKPSINLKKGVGRFGAEGRLALERPRNFKLEIMGPLHTVKADIGSNDEEFWFWINDDDRKVYWCRHDELDSGAIAVTYQPDWIIDSLGLKPISPQDARGIKVREGEIRGTTALVFPARTSGGQTYTRMLIVWNKDRRIKEHRLYEGSVPSTRGLMAQAEVSRYTEYATDSAEASDGEKCYLPESVRLEWKRDQITLDVALGQEDVKVNQFDSSRSTALFVEPVTGHNRVNLAEMSRSQRRDPGTTRTRQTLSPPGTRNGSRANRTISEPNDTTMVPAARRKAAPSAGGSTTTPLEDLVTAPLPVAPETAAMASSPTDLYQIGR